MLTITTGRKFTCCDRLARRDFLRVGGLGWGGLTLAGLLRARAGAAGTRRHVKPKSVVFVFLAGGPSQYEMFDPKMTAPVEIRSMTGEVQTTLPGVTFGGTFPELARLAHRMAIVRSFTPASTDHRQAAAWMLAGHDGGPGNLLADASIGSQYARLRGTNHPRSGIPTYSLLAAPDVDEPFISFHLESAVLGSGAGSLGPAYAPFNPAGGSTAVENMRLNVPAERLGDRRRLLAQLDRISRRIDATGALAACDQFDEQAFEVITRGAAQALDLAEEDPRTLERYDTSEFKFDHHLNPTKVGSSTLGTQMLLARRLCEAGSGFVTVASGGWDMHADDNNRGIIDGMRVMGRPLDKAVSAFLQDLDERGLSDDILLVITGEFGRTPKINANGGRDHWGGICPLAFAGGGLRMGQVIGQSARNGDVPAGESFSASHLLGTLMHTLFDVPTLRVEPGLPRDLLERLDRCQPIERLV